MMVKKGPWTETRKEPPLENYAQQTSRNARPPFFSQRHTYG